MAIREQVHIEVSENGTRTVRRNIDDIGKSANGAQDAIKSLLGVLAGFAAAAGLNEIRQMIDAYGQVSERLMIVTQNARDFRAVQQELQRVAATTYSSYTDLADSFANSNRTLKELGLSLRQQIDLQEAVISGAIVSGASDEKRIRIQDALNKAIAQGTLRGEEWNTVNTAGGRIADAVAKSIGVTNIQLANMATNGGIAIDKVIKGLLTSLPELQQEITNMAASSQDGFRVLKNAITVYYGQVDQAYGLSAGFAALMVKLADNIDEVTDATIRLAIVFAPLFAGATIRAAIALVGTLAAALGTVTVAVSLLVGVIASLVYSFATADKEMDELLATMGRSVTAIDRMVAAWAGSVAYIKALFGGLASGIGEAFRAVFDFVVKDFEIFINRVIGWLSALGDMVQWVVDTTGFSSAGEQAAGAFDEAYRDELLRRSTANADLSGLGGNNTLIPPQFDNDKNKNKRKPATFASEIAELQREIDVVRSLKSEREPLQRMYQIENKLRRELTDSERSQVRAMVDQLTLEKDATKVADATNELYNEQTALLVENVQERERLIAIQQLEATLSGEMSEENKALIDSIISRNQELQDEVAILDALNGPLNDYNRQTEALKRLHDDGKISAREYNNELRNTRIALLESNTDAASGVERAILKQQQSFSDSATLVEDAFTGAFESANDALLGFLQGGTDSIDDWAKNAKNSIIAYLYDAFAKPMMLNIVANLVGVNGQGQQQGGGGGGLLSSITGGGQSGGWMNNLGSLGTGVQALTGASFGASAGSLAGANLVGAAGGDALGALIAGNGGWATAGSAAGSAIGAVATALPYIGLAIAAYALISSMTQGETRNGGQYGYTSGNSLTNNRRGTTTGVAGPGTYFLEGPSGGSGDDGAVKDAINSTVDAVNGVFAGLGNATRVDGFWGGWETSEKGRGGVMSGGRLSTGEIFGEAGTGSNYKGTLYEKHSTTSPDGQEAVENFITDLYQSAIQAFQAKADEMPRMIQAIIGGVDAEALTQEQAQEMVGLISTIIAEVNALSDTLDTLPFPNVRDLTFEATAALIEFAGGVDALMTSQQTYFERFYSEQEQLDHLQEQLARTLGSVNIALPTTNEAYRAAVEALDLLTEEGQRAYTVLMASAGSFADLTDGLARLNATVVETVDTLALANEAFDAQHALTSGIGANVTRLTALRGTIGGLLDSIAGSLGGVGDQAWRAAQTQRLWASIATASTEQQVTIAGDLHALIMQQYTEQQAAANTLLNFSKSLRQYVAGLQTSDLAPGNLAERMASAQDRYAELLAASQAGDQDAMAQLSGASTTYLELARQFYASSDMYRQIFDTVTSELNGLADQTQTEAERQLSVSNEQLQQLEQLRSILQGAASKTEQQIAQQQAELQRHTTQLITMGIDTGRLHDVAALLQSLPAGIAAELQPIWDAAANKIVNEWYDQSGRPADKGGADYWKDQLATRPQDDVKQSFNYGIAAEWYQTHMKRQAAENEIAYWAKRIEQIGLAQALAGFKDSDEYRSVNSHATGLWNVPYDGYQMTAHAGERVLTSAQAASFDWLARSASNENRFAGKDIEAMYDVQSSIEQLRSEMREHIEVLVRAQFEASRENANRVNEAAEAREKNTGYIDRIREKQQRVAA